MAAGFLAVVLVAAGLRAGTFNEVRLAAAFVATLAAGFFATAGFLAVAFLAPASSLTPAFLAIFAKLALRRAAVFFLIKPFLTAVSSSLWAALRPFADGLARKVLVASLISRLMPTLRSRRLMVCFARLIADLMIGINDSLSSDSLCIQSRCNYRVNVSCCKE